jgi:hypothetical protein
MSTQPVPGGSSQLIIRRNTIKTNRKDNAKKRAIEKLGEEEAGRIIKAFSDLSLGYGNDQWSTADGVIMTLIQLNLSQIEAKSLLGIGSTRYNYYSMYDWKWKSLFES